MSVGERQGKPVAHRHTLFRCLIELQTPLVNTGSHMTLVKDLLDYARQEEEKLSKGAQGSPAALFSYCSHHVDHHQEHSCSAIYFLNATCQRNKKCASSRTVHQLISQRAMWSPAFANRTHLCRIEEDQISLWDFRFACPIWQPVYLQ